MQRLKQCHHPVDGDVSSFHVGQLVKEDMTQSVLTEGTQGSDGKQEAGAEYPADSRAADQVRLQDRHGSLETHSTPAALEKIEELSVAHGFLGSKP
jgi:hypothetical protein